MTNPIHDLDSAAERAKVTPKIIRRWITEGLKASPVGKVGKRGPRDFRIFDSWLLEFLEARAVRVLPQPISEPEPSRRRAPKAPPICPGARREWIPMPDLSGRDPR